MRTSIDVWEFASGDELPKGPYLSRLNVWEKRPSKGGVMKERISATITFFAQSHAEAIEKAAAWWVAEQARQAASELRYATAALSRKRRAPDAQADA